MKRRHTRSFRRDLVAVELLKRHNMLQAGSKIDVTSKVGALFALRHCFTLLACDSRPTKSLQSQTRSLHEIEADIVDVIGAYS